ncbi:hypothetical protein WA026_003543 [Henosepilachna vigintioctopunctata]|uniref:Uncharacterized protein n=1 Tax=Henosepilachna vigintioctopunctata TaxID=420089 RepID=A0AAW1TND9_9CUCU
MPYRGSIEKKGFVGGGQSENRICSRRTMENKKCKKTKIGVNAEKMGYAAETNTRGKNEICCWGGQENWIGVVQWEKNMDLLQKITGKVKKDQLQRRKRVKNMKFTLS